MPLPSWALASLLNCPSSSCTTAPRQRQWAAPHHSHPRASVPSVVSPPEPPTAQTLVSSAVLHQFPLPTFIGITFDFILPVTLGLASLHGAGQ